MTLFGSSGIRRVVDKEFLQLAFEIGLATGGSYRSLVLGSDTRTSRDAVRYAFLAGLLSAGSEAHYAGIVPTPTLAYGARDFEAGAMITASHNPPEYNGIKLINPDGSAFDTDQRTRIDDRVRSGSSLTAPWTDMKECRDRAGIADDHIERVLQDFPGKLHLKVAVDCGGGAASAVTPRLLARLGCEVVPLNCEPTANCPRAGEPVAENLKDLSQAVISGGADLGIAHDGDADRIAVIDEKGDFVPQDRLMALLARHLEVSTIVTTVDASMLIDDLGFSVVRTRVGDAFVSEEMRRRDMKDSAQSFGGESSGCFIFPQVSLCPDAIYAAAAIAQIAGGKRISSLIDGIPSYPVIRGTVAGEKEAMAEIGTRLGQNTGGDLLTIDGLRLGFSDGWLLIRPSGTEPKIRVTAEATSERRARELYDLGVKTVEESVTAAGQRGGGAQ